MIATLIFRSISSGGFFRNPCRDVIQQLVHAQPVLGGNRENILNSQRIEIVHQRFFGRRYRPCSRPA